MMQTALVIGDLHAGSPYAPFPAGFVTSYGTEHAPNPAQIYLNRRRTWPTVCHRLTVSLPTA